MSILKKLFGGGGNGASAPVVVAAETKIDGVKVEATPIEEGGQYRLAALLTKEIGGEMKTHKLIRADLFPNRDDAVQAAFRKAELLLKEQGDTIFR